MKLLIVILAYVVSHGLVATIITPVQGMLLPEVTVFASLIYLPHGVRVLATWALGWMAIPAICVGAAIAALLFTSADHWDLLQPALLESIFVGACCAFLAFELVRWFGYDFYIGRSKKLDWKGMIYIGGISSIINSLGQTIVYSGMIGIGQMAPVLFIYMLGDLIGLVVCMVALMFVFRVIRFSSAQR